MKEPLEVLNLYPPHDYTLQGAFASRASRGPERPFILFEGRAWSWKAFEGESAVQKRLAGSEEWRIHVVNVRLSPDGRRGNRGDATVTYDKLVRLSERNLPEVSTRHVASVVYEYQPKVLAKEKDRLENPFGFVVTAYRSDPEINTPPTGPAVVATKP